MHRQMARQQRQTSDKGMPGQLLPEVTDRDAQIRPSAAETEQLQEGVALLALQVT